jgi:type I restriction enzyme S subunit
VAINTVPMATNQGFKSFVPSSRVDPSYLYWWLKTNTAYLESLGNGATFKEISKSAISRVSIPLPPKCEQVRVVAILDKADDIRRKREQKLALADDLLRAAFLEMFGDPCLNPHGYSMRRFGSLLSASLRNGISPSSKGGVKADVLTLSAITGNSFDPTQKKEGQFLNAISVKDQVSEHDFYICRGNGSPELVGRGFFARQSMPGVAFPDTMIAALPRSEELQPGFLELIWNSPFVRNQIVNSARTTNGTYKINQTAVENIELPVPAVSLQIKFEEVGQKIKRIKERLGTEEFGDSTLFAALTQRAFRGEL